MYYLCITKANKMKIIEVKATDLKVGNSVKYNSLFREITEVSFGEWESVAESNKGEKIPMVLVKFSTYKNTLQSGSFHVNSTVKVKI